MTIRINCECRNIDGECSSYLHIDTKEGMKTLWLFSANKVISIIPPQWLSEAIIKAHQEHEKAEQ